MRLPAMIRVWRLGCRTGVAGTVYYDAAGNEWRRIIGPLWWLLAALLLTACEPPVNHVNVPCDAIHPTDHRYQDACSRGGR